MKKVTSIITVVLFSGIAFAGPQNSNSASNADIARAIVNKIRTTEFKNCRQIDYSGLQALTPTQRTESSQYIAYQNLEFYVESISQSSDGTYFFIRSRDQIDGRWLNEFQVWTDPSGSSIQQLTASFGTMREATVGPIAQANVVEFFNAIRTFTCLAK